MTAQSTATHIATLDRLHSTPLSTSLKSGAPHLSYRRSPTMKAVVSPQPSPPESAKSSKSSASDMGKRTKSSRACDECRRKKIRCDIDNGALICSPCQRMGTVCAFSRVQLKRGPSKRIRSYSDGPQPQLRGGQLPGIDALLSWSSAGMTQQPQLSIPTNVQPMAIPGRHENGMLPGAIATPSPDMSSMPLASPDLRSSISSSNGFGSVPNTISFPGLPSTPTTNGTSPPPHPASLPNNDSKIGIRRGSLPVPMRVPMATLAAAASYADSLSTSTTSPKPSGATNVSPTSNGYHIDVSALSNYYQNWHVIFPILPDNPDELEGLLASGPAGNWLAAAINGTARTVPIDQLASGTARTVQVMALIFVYLYTLEFTWLGAAVANVLTVIRENSAEGRRLYHIVIALDRLHSAIYQTSQLMSGATDLPTDGTLRRTFWALGAEGTTPPLPPYEPSVIALQWLSHPHSTQARAELEQLAPALYSTPLYPFVRAVLQGGKS